VDGIISITSIYFYVVVGYFIKVLLKDALDEKSIVKLNIYVLLPLLAFWGLLTQKIDTQMLKVPLVYLLITFIGLGISSFVAKKLFSNPKDISIVSMASVTGITGSIGIPLGISLFSSASIIYTSLINTVSMIFAYSVGVYLYSRGKFGVKESLVNVLKIPIVGVSALAIILNIYGFKMNEIFFKNLEMGAHGAIVIQLIIFGIFLSNVKLKEIDTKLMSIVLLLKFVSIPIIAFVVLQLFTFAPLHLNVIILELIVPLAVTNISLASLFDTRPNQVTALVFVSSFVFIPYVLFVGF